MLVIGLTGGISSGKSTVANLFAQYGIEIIDADRIARSLVAHNSPHYQQIVKHFGNDIVDQTGELDRAKLKAMIFADPKAKAWLENLLHPEIFNIVKQRINTCSSAYCIVDAALLLETKSTHLADRILVIDTSKEQQIKRTMARDQLDETTARSIIDQQASRQERLRAADDIIINDSDIAALAHKVKQLHQCYLQLAKA